MRRLLQVIVIVAALPSRGFAQPADACPECMIGLWIGSFSANFDYSQNLSPIRVAVGYWSSEGASVQGVEFSVSNLENFLVQFDPPPGATLVGTPPAPSDTTGTNTGGMMITWDTCLPPGDVSVLWLTLTPLSPDIVDHVLWVLRRFPPTVLGTQGPTFTKCGASEPTSATGRQAGSCFVVNPSAPSPGVVEGCLYYAGLAVRGTPWSTVKLLYR